MDNHEAQQFVANEVVERFPETTWTATLTLDWEQAVGVSWLDRRAAVLAIKTLQAESKVKKPNLDKFLKSARMLCPSRSSTRTEFFVQYQGGGKTRLNPGFFFQIITTDERCSQVAHSTSAAMECMHGGAWKVIRDTNWSTMIAQRREYSR